MAHQVPIFFKRNLIEFPQDYKPPPPRPKRAAPSPQQLLDGAFQRERLNKIYSNHFLNSKRFPARPRGIPDGVDFAVISRNGADHRRLHFLDRMRLPDAPVSCSCLRARPDLGGGGGGGGGDGGEGGGGEGGCGCNCGGPGGAESGGPDVGGGFAGGASEAGQSGASCVCIGSDANCTGGFCGACTPGGGGCTAGASQGGPSGQAPGGPPGQSNAEAAAGLEAGSLGGSSFGGPSADFGAAFASAPSGAPDFGAMADVGGMVGSFGGLPADIGSAFAQAGPSSFGSNFAGPVDLGPTQGPDFSPESGKEAAGWGQFANPGVAQQSVAGWNSIVGPAETATELGQMMASTMAERQASLADVLASAPLVVGMYNETSHSRNPLRAVRPSCIQDRWDNSLFPTSNRIKYPYRK